MCDYQADIAQADIAKSLAQPGDAARLAALAELAGAVQHEFNNLRATIEGTLDLIAADPTSGVTERRLVRLRNASTRAAALADSLATLARLHHGRGPASDLGAWLLAARPWLAERLGESVTLALDVPHEAVLSTAHPDSLRVVLRALISNARGAIANGGTVTVKVAPATASGEVCVAVTDDGAGMTAQVLARAREPFFTTHPPAAGLGLTLVELFARENGGSLEIASVPGHGTTVSLRMPVADGP